MVLAIVAAYAAGIGPFESDAPKPTPEITSFEITDRGCRADVREFSHGRVGPNGSFVHAETLDTASSATELSAQIRRTSPGGAAITTYRLDVQTHEQTPANASCPGRIAYRIEYDAPAGPTGVREAVFVDGRLRSCGGSTSGGDLGCRRLQDDLTTHWSNASDE